ncbi:uncharacterized protein LOC143582964 [Bidens hawaiensis]|uniref:uncharacterized protein LOC143582964 n=1 Tax=Bidens hawaiensis TaxID=980011 RepID=UPI004049E25F
MYEDAMEELTSLYQTGTLIEYCQAFDLLLNKVTLSEEYAISGQPSYAPKLPLLETPISSVPAGRNSAAKRLTSKELEDKPSKGECFWCTERFVPGHRCKSKQLMVIEVEEEEGMGQDESHTDTTTEPQISIHALTSVPSFSTMRVRGAIGTRPLHILIDSDLTHNFLDKKMAVKLNYSLHDIGAMKVKVANGDSVSSMKECPAFNWLMQGLWFTTNVLLLPLDNYDMVLGVQWLLTLGNITWNFQNLTMQFNVDEKPFELKGLDSNLVIFCSANKLQDLLSHPTQIASFQLCSMQLSPLSQNDVTSNFQHNSHVTKVVESVQLEELLKEFEDVFQEPHGLPPQRVCDHQITLKEGTTPIQQRPYRYHATQKDVIEQMTRELQATGFIQNSQSPFASPVILVKKKDNSWRMCIDYRRLNDATIKNKLAIPLIDELLEELGGSSVFSKLDLRSGYHQVRMHSNDIHKTAFHTHEGHFEFLVMPFGLTNAPATFQSLMNSIFKEILRKCVLVFFYDILIYSKNITQHLQNLQAVLFLMRHHKLFAKLSKCTFGGLEVDYLGYIITKGGVYRLHGWLTTIVSDRDVVFLSAFWTDFMKLHGVSLALSTSYHPPDGQTEAVNKCLENYLRAMVFERPNTWFSWLALAEWWYNTNYHLALGMTLFQAIYGFPPPLHIPYIPHDTKVAAVDVLIQERHRVTGLLKQSLHKARNRMKQFANRNRSERSFEVGSWVFLKIQPYCQQTVRAFN